MIILNERSARLYVAAGFCILLVLYCCGVLLLYFVNSPGNYWYRIAAGYCDCIDASAARGRRRAPAHGRVGEEVEVEGFHVPLNEGLSLSCSGCMRGMVASQRISLRAGSSKRVPGGARIATAPAWRCSAPKTRYLVITGHAFSRVKLCSFPAQIRES